MAKKQIKKETIKIKDISVGKFFSLTTKKIVLDLILSSLLFLWLSLSVPVVKDILMKENIPVRIFDVIGNILLYMLIFYPLTCYIILLIFKKERE